MKLSREIPSLDGLRALSILLVVMGHIYNGLLLRGNYLLAVSGNSNMGVTIFFVISGYLITHLLLKEHQKKGSISLKNFYIRRAFRILPPCYFYIAVMAVCGMLGIFAVRTKALLSAALFIWDYSPWREGFVFEHLWSLSVEEQFYFLWPALLIFSLRRGQNFAIRVAIALICIAPVLRMATYFLHIPGMDTNLNYMLHTRMDSLMFGCLMALAEGKRWFENLYQRIIPLRYVMTVFVLIFSPMLAMRFGGAYKFGIACTVDGFCIAVVLLWLVRNPASGVGRLFNAAPVKKIGVLSYSIYIWQTVFLHVQNQTWTGHLPISLLLIALCSCFSYYLVEQPMMSLRNKLFPSEPRQICAALAD